MISSCNRNLNMLKEICTSIKKYKLYLQNSIKSMTKKCFIYCRTGEVWYYKFLFIILTMTCFVCFISLRAAFMCGREPNFELPKEEKRELCQIKWEDFLAMTRQAIISKSNVYFH